MSVDCFRETRRGGLVRPASKSCRFSHHPLRVPKAWHRDFAACGQRSGLLAHTSAAFLKNCCTEKLLFCIVFSNCFFNHRIKQATTCNRPPTGQKRNDHERNLDFHCSSSAPAIFITPMQHTRTPPVSHSEAKPASVPAAAGIQWAAFGAAFRPAQASLSARRAKASASDTGLSAGCDCHHR